MPGRALLLLNPKARRGRDAGTEVRGGLEASGLGVVPAGPSDWDRLPDLIARARNQVDRVVVAGGDGTLNTAVQALAGTDLPLAILPLGTANNLARSLGLPNDLKEACEVAAKGTLRAIDLGWINGRYFFTTASMGLSVTSVAGGRWRTP
jgi:diacylglycerol kinase (ATP)